MSATTTISDSESESESPLSPSISSPSSLDPSLTEQFQSCSMNSTPTCRPNLYESSNPLRSTQSGQYPFYNVYAGDHPGCYRDWADASGRVTNVKGSRHKGYKTWAQALEGWKQNCRSYHHHPSGFVEGTKYSPSPRAETPPCMTPPMSHHNREFFEAKVTPSVAPRHAPQNINVRTSDDSAESPQYWAIHSAGAQAQMILDEASGRNEEISLRLVTSLSEAEAWLRLG
ncbi:hypothetical protein F5880DRAFT_1618369 [Lentinula raphanica]|nr:hypothetical protein F5880DRAFT_1618369 [Lentinula raphanica]